ncbi:MAG: PD-(D/E)XK nuclease family protein [Bacilli bacterium]|nr:PD-(D/E)XK nuclease family protein [Bacilli bacterium]
MDILNNIKDNTLIITSNENKKKILCNINKLYNIKFMTKTQFIKKYLFDYDEKTIYYVMKKYNTNYYISKMYLDNLIFINGDFSDFKIKFLNEMKKDLIDNNLLMIDNLFKKYIEQKNIIIYDVELNKFEQNIFNKINNVEIINLDVNNIKVKEVYEFDYIENEVEFVANEIINLLNKNIDINNIKILNLTDEYEYYIKRIFGFYNIPINYPESKMLYGNKAIIDFINNLRENKNIATSLEKISDIDIKNEAVKICNKYNFTEVDDAIIDCLISEFKNVKININKKKNAIDFININTQIENEYVFFIGFNENNIPKIYKDENYLNDDLRKKLNIDSSIDLNELEGKKVIKKIAQINNLFISYKLKTPFEVYYKSNLVEKLNLNIIKNKEIPDKYNYSDIYNNICLAKYLDNLNKFNEYNKDLNLLLSTYKNNYYNKYDNKYKKINEQDLYDYLDNKLLLSYTSIQNYYECGFKYYLSNILKLDKYEETISTKIGTVFHDVLSKCFDDNFDYENYYNELINKNNFSKKELVFFNILKKDLLFVIETIKKQNNLTHLKDELYEQKIYINKDKNIKVTFMGIVDKIKYKKEYDKTVLAVIDYKTGSLETDLNKTIYGLKMQLPIYLYLAKNSNLFDNVEIAGFYLQKVLHNDINYNPNKDYEKEIENNLKLEGYSNDDINILERFDITYKASEMIKSMKITQNGFYVHSKIMSKEKIDKLITLTEQKINEAEDNILQAKFDINPKRIKEELISCKYCKFNCICYKKEEDIVNLKEYKKLEFLD